MAERRALIRSEDESESLRPQNRERKQKVGSRTDYSYSYGESSGNNQSDKRPAKFEAIPETEYTEEQRKIFMQRKKQLIKQKVSNATEVAAKEYKEGSIAFRLYDTESKHIKNGSGPWDYEGWRSKQEQDAINRNTSLTDAEDSEISRGRSIEETAKIIDETYGN